MISDVLMESLSKKALSKMDIESTIEKLISLKMNTNRIHVNNVYT